MAFTVKYEVEYETKASANAIIDGTVLEDLKGWPMLHRFDLPARDDSEAVRLIRDWYDWEMDVDLMCQRRYLVGEPRLLKVTTMDWKKR